MRRALFAMLGILALAGHAEAADFRMSVIETGVRSYYCTMTVRLENGAADTVNDLNGYFVLYAGNDQVGQSRASSFLDVAPGATSDAIFEAPNAPCSEITDVSFVVSACRIDQSFRDRADCVGRLETTPPIREAVAR